MAHVQQMRIGRGDGTIVSASFLGNSAVGQAHGTARTVVVARPQQPGSKSAVDAQGPNAIEPQLGKVESGFLLIDTHQPDQVIDNFSHAYGSECGIVVGLKKLGNLIGSWLTTQQGDDGDCIEDDHRLRVLSLADSAR
jgi:hypothetical protein